MVGIYGPGAGQRRFLAAPPAPIPPPRLEQLQTLAAEATAVITTPLETTNSTTYTDLATAGPAVTVPVGPMGILLVGLYAEIGMDSGTAAYMSFTLSGANTQSADDTYSIRVDVGNSVTDVSTFSLGATFLLPDLTPGPTTVTAKYRAGATQLVNFQNRRVFALPL